MVPRRQQQPTSTAWAVLAFFLLQCHSSDGLVPHLPIHQLVDLHTAAVSHPSAAFLSSSPVPSSNLPSFLQHSFLTASTDASTTTTSTTVLSSDDITNNIQSLLHQASNSYQHSLQAHALQTKVATGIVLAVVGDAIAQRSTRPDPSTPYDAKRAIAFCLFDGCYRAVQQVTYPPMIQLCQGAFLGGLLHSMGLLSLEDAAAAASSGSVSMPAALEQTLVSQLVIIPTLYYPSFYAITGVVQGLTVDETIQRAKDTFVPLMQRNLAFWIPVQFLAFAFVEENLQIPLLIACGLVWTVILSFSAGAVKQQQPAVPEPLLDTVMDTDSTGLDRRLPLLPQPVLAGSSDRMGQNVTDSALRAQEQSS